MATLDVLAAQAVFTARAFERAVHDPGPWHMTWGHWDVPASRLIGRDGIYFEATFPEHCYLVEPDSNLTLWCRYEPMLARAIPFPGDQSFKIGWDLTVRDATLVL